MPPDDARRSCPAMAPTSRRTGPRRARSWRASATAPAKPLKVKVSTRNIAIYRDPAVILIDQLKSIHIDGELEVVDTSIWHAKVTRKEFAVGMNLTGVGVDDPDVNLYENYACNSERNFTQYCNKEVDALIDKQSQEPDVGQAQADRVGDREAAGRGPGAPDHLLRARGDLLAAAREGLRAAPQQHLQQLALRGRVAGQVGVGSSAGRLAGSIGEPLVGAYLVRRFLLMLLTLFGMSVLIFVMLRLVPGNITDIIFDSAGFVNPAQKAKIERQLGLDQPIVTQYVTWISGLARGDLGYAYVSEKPAHRRDPAAHSGHGQAGGAGAVLLRPVRRAARRDQRGAAEHAARLRAAGRQPQRAVAALVLARAADPDGVRAVVRLDSDLPEHAGQFLAARLRCSAFRPRPWVSAAPRW